MTASLWFSIREYDDHTPVSDDQRTSEAELRRTLASDHPDYAIVTGIQAGDRAAFDTLYLRAYPILYRLAKQWCSTHDAADDLVQTVFVDLWFRRESWQIRTSAVSYLVGAVRNALRHQLRHAAIANRTADLWQALDLNPAMGQPPASPEAATEQQELVDAVTRAMIALPPRQRMAMLLHWQDGLTSGEIAEVMEISDRVARKFLARGLETLQRALQKTL